MSTDVDLLEGYTLLSSDPVVVEDLRTEGRFSGHGLLAEHNVASGISIVIGSTENPWGILGTYTTEHRTYTEHDEDFIRSVATILTRAIERLQRERELRTEKDRFRRLVQSVEEYAIFMLDPDGYVVSWNEGAERIKGYREDEILGEHFSTFYPDEARRDGFPARALELAAADGVFMNEGWRVRADGTEFWADVTISALYDDDGKLHGFTKVTQDLTDQREREQILRREHELLETNPAGIVVVDPDGTIARANTRAGHLYGRDPDDLQGDDYDSLEGKIVDEGGDPLAADKFPVCHVFATGEPVYDELIGIEQDSGVQTWLSVSAAPIRSPDGTIESVITTATDITKHREHERRLRAFREALDYAGQAVYLVGTDGTIKYVNAAFEEQTGYSAADAIGGTPLILRSSEHSEAFYGNIWETVFSGDVWTGEVVNRSKAGETYTVNQTIAPITNEDGNIEQFIAINTDLTEQKEREQTLRQQRNTLERLRQITTSLNSIHHALIHASNREELEQLVCDALGSSEAYADAWIGEYVAADDAIKPHAWTGVEEDALSEEIESVNKERMQGITKRAIQTGEVQAVQNLIDDFDKSARDPALHRGYNAAAAVPIVYGNTIYGVLCLHSTRSFAFNKTEQRLLREIGERIGYAIFATKNRQLLHADTKVELEFRSTTSESTFNEVSDQLNCKLSLLKHTPASEGSFVYYIDVEDAPPEQICNRIAAASGVDHARPLQATGDAGTIECRVTDASLGLALAEYGATLRTVESRNGEATIIAQVAPDTNTRAIIEDVRSTFPQTEFISKRTVDQHAMTTDDRSANPLEALTDRQREVLETAYHAGYFDSPRRTSGEELADTLGIASATFYQHVRKGSQNLLAELTTSELDY